MKLYLSKTVIGNTREETVKILEEELGVKKARRLCDRMDRGEADIVHFEVKGVTYYLERRTHNER